MPRKESLVLTDHELRLMDVLWSKGRAAVSEITAALSPPLLAYNTVLSTMRTLEQKGYVTHEEAGRAFAYSPLMERNDAAKSAVKHVLARFFQNSPDALAVAYSTTLSCMTAIANRFANCSNARSRRDVLV